MILSIISGIYLNYSYKVVTLTKYEDSTITLANNSTRTRIAIVLHVRVIAVKLHVFNTSLNSKGNSAPFRYSLDVVLIFR